MDGYKKMRHIYAPHRSSYFELPRDEECLFCRLIREDTAKDRENLIIYRGRLCFVMLNKYPYNNGHTMVVPYGHFTYLKELDSKTISEIYTYLKIIESTLLDIYNADGINIGLNIKEAAGAGIRDHIHYHILPRWKGDSNFMTSVSDTRVVPEDFRETYRKIKSGFEAI